MSTVAKANTLNAIFIIMDIKEPLFSEGPDARLEITVDDSRGLRAAPRRFWKHIIIVLLVISVSIRFLRYYEAEFVFEVSQDRTLKHEHHLVDQDIWRGDEFKTVST